MRTLHLHIGLPKTASTWLQERVFPALGHLDVRAMPRTRLFRAPGDAKAEHRLMGCVVRRAPAIWPAMGDAILDELAPSAGAAEGRDLLVSDEAFGRAASHPEALGAHLRGLAAAATARGFGRVAVVVLLRRQDTWLASHYAQVSDRAARAGQRDFERMVAQLTDPARSRYLGGMMVAYDALLEALHGAVGAENVTVLAHEALSADREGALARILDALGTPEGDRDAVMAAATGGAPTNRRSDPSGSWALRPRRIGARHGAPGTGIPLPLWLDRARGRGIALTPDLSRRILAAYRDANARAAAAAGLDLAAHGYIVDDRP